jgi:hypothetical protein
VSILRCERAWETRSAFEDALLLPGSLSEKESEKDFGSFQQYLWQHSYPDYRADLVAESCSKTSEVWLTAYWQLVGKRLRLFPATPSQLKSIFIV